MSEHDPAPSNATASPHPTTGAAAPRVRQDRDRPGSPDAGDAAEAFGAREAALLAATTTVPYLDDRPKTLVSGKNFARALALLEAVLERLDTHDEAGPAALELQWATIELADHSTLAPTEPVRAQLPARLPAREHVEAAAITAISGHLTALVDSSTDLADTLRYLRVLEHLNTAHTLLAAVPPQQPQPAAPLGAADKPADEPAHESAREADGPVDGSGDGSGDGAVGGEGRG